MAVASAALFVALGIVPLSGLAQAIDWNVIMMIAGTMGTVWFFILSGMPALLADRILRRVRTVQWATVSLAFFSGLISALMDNVATMLPVASGIAQIMGVDAFLLYFGIMVGATLGGNLTPHRRFGQYHRHRAAAQGRVYRAHRGFSADRRAQHPYSGGDRVCADLADLRLILRLRRRRLRLGGASFFAALGCLPGGAGRAGPVKGVKI